MANQLKQLNMEPMFTKWPTNFEALCCALQCRWCNPASNGVGDKGNPI